ncbi:MAG TPA: LysM peptidoglycan-binding domain-containing protein [Caldithrix abyssi]|uniref:LysM peptidoglycan-binding domain-containing protein n=1 Tax=Caldithrix abyssi TaxID=187145 RepID=A0A7V4U298_CALAY|nr:LysM peptidoglycan-binding domain-containing protein [Caldithrix abyssi]
MMKYKGLLTLVTGIVLVFGCSRQMVKEESTSTPQDLPENMPDQLWVSDAFSVKIDSVFRFYRFAKASLADGDTLGAEIYFNTAFEIVSQFSESDRLTLQHWIEFDSMFKDLSDEYERIYLQTTVTPEAEEIREDITDLEERFFPDSVLYGSGTVIDSLGGFPITVNDKVRLAIKYFQTKGRVVFTKWLRRSGRYEQLIKEVLEEKNLPSELMYIAMIESGFNPKARSYARAVGMWQFISATGRYYGLRNNWWFDERRDVIKSTIAAATHLAELYERFGDWYLALAGYNCNPRKVDYNIRRYKSRDFWKLKRLPRQTRNYVPTFLAAAIIAENPAQFGFTVEKLEPIRVDTVLISESVDLNVIAKIVDTTYAYIKEINPAVLRWVTPPGVKNFTLYLPEGTRQKFKEEYAKIPDSKKRSWVRHRIRPGETLSTIAQKYHTSMAVIKSTNRIRGSFIRAGDYLLIPVPQNKSHYYTYSPKSRTHSTAKKRSKPRVVKNVPGHKKIIYRVKPGDTLGEIAEIYNTRASKIRAWNGLYYGQHIYPRQELAIWVPENLSEMKAQAKKRVKIKEDIDPSMYYVVKRGDTLWDIARKYNLSIKQLKELNNMRTSRIRPGDKLRISSN